MQSTLIGCPIKVDCNLIYRCNHICENLWGLHFADIADFGKNREKPQNALKNLYYSMKFFPREIFKFTDIVSNMIHFDKKCITKIIKNCKTRNLTNESSTKFYPCEIF